MKRRIWIDVTDFLKWKGALTGFQHIQYHISKFYIESGKDVAFFVYNEPSREFVEIPFNPDDVVVSGIRSESNTPSGSQRVGESIIRKVKGITPDLVKSIIKKTLGRSPSVRPGRSAVKSPFQKDDLVLVLGGIWHGSFADDMASEKRDKKFKFVHIVHDMIPVMCPQYVVEDLPEVFASYKEKIFRIADGLIINSKSSKRDALEFMKARGIKPPPSKVFRLADEMIESEKPEAVGGLKSKQFILSLGTVEGRKNHMLLYYTYKQAARNKVELPKMVIAGREGWLVGDFLYMVSRDPEVKDKFMILGGVSNTQRAWLYENCLFTVWPSYYEGWGMPVAESLAYGKLCLSSDVSSMPEVGGDLAEYFSPFSPDECLTLIRKYCDAKIREDKEQQIKKSYKTTTWRDMFNEIDGFMAKI